MTPVVSPGAGLDKDMSRLQLSDLDIGLHVVLKRYMEGKCQPEADKIKGFSPASRACPIPKMELCITSLKARMVVQEG